jgi:hypothetical protein
VKKTSLRHSARHNMIRLQGGKGGGTQKRKGFSRIYARAKG